MLISNPITDLLLGRGDLFGLTFGMNYTPQANWLIRPEIRWDQANQVVPFDDQSSDRQFTASVDVVFQF